MMRLSERMDIWMHYTSRESDSHAICVGFSRFVQCPTRLIDWESYARAEEMTISPAWATPSGALCGEVTMHCRVIRLSMPGMAGEMEMEMVTTVVSGGAIKTAFHPGSTDIMPPLLTSQVTLVFGGMDPSRVNGSSLPANILQSSGRIVSVLVGIATALEGISIESDNKRATMRTTLRDINILGFNE